MFNNGRARLRGAAAAAAAALALAACSTESHTPPGFQGTVEYEERQLGFALTGRVTQIDVRRGDVVTDEQVLAKLDDTLEKLTRAARVNAAESARADLALLESGAKREDVAALAAQVRAATTSEHLLAKVAERARALHATGGISEAELDRANAEHQRATAERASMEQRLASLRRGARSEELERARARLAGATTELASADERLARRTLHAFGPGEVLDVHLERGEMAAPGAPVVTVADTSHPYTEVFVPQGDLEGIRAGVKATVRVDAGNTSLPAAVEHVGARTEFTPRYLFSERERPHLVVRVRVRIDDPERLLHAGVPAFVTFAR